MKKLKKALPAIILSTVSAAFVAVLVVASTKPYEPHQKTFVTSEEAAAYDRDVELYRKYGIEYDNIKYMEEEYERLSNKKHLSEDEKTLLESLPRMIDFCKKDLGIN